MFKILAMAYLLWCGALYLLQDRVLFPRHLIGPPPPKPPPQAVVAHRQLPGGGQVEAWFFPAPGASAEQPAPAVIFFHGNAELIDFQEWIIAGYRRLGCSVLLPEYRGYGRSAGKPSQKNIRADAIGFYEQLIGREDVDAGHIIFHGRSVGGAVAADLADPRKPAALIIESCFRSVVSMANHYGVPGFLTRHPYRVDHVIRQLDVPLLIFHGTADSIIPVKHGRALHRTAPASVYVEYDCGHNNLPPEGKEEDYWQRIESFLRDGGIIKK